MNQQLPWIVLFSPLVAALLILLFARKEKTLSSYLSVVAVAVSFLGSCVLFFTPADRLRGAGFLAGVAGELRRVDHPT